jgi:hypothetical protein
VAAVGGGGGGGGGQRRRWRWRSRYAVLTAVMATSRRRAASTVAVATCVVESGGDLESFGIKGKMAWGGLLFISSKISTVVLI